MTKYGKICRFHSCPSRSKLHPEKKFYPFAKPWMDLEKCQRWISATGRKDLTPDSINKHFYVCGDHFVNGAPSEENPDPLPMNALTNETQPMEENLDDPPELSTNENLNQGDSNAAQLSTASEPSFIGTSDGRSPVFSLKSTMSPARRAALALKKKATSPSPRKSHGVPSEIRVTPSRHQVNHANREIAGSTEDVEVTRGLKEKLRNSNMQRKLFDEFMMEISEAESNHGAEEPLGGRLFQDMFVDGREGTGGIEEDTLDESIEVAEVVIEKDGKRSVGTQTLSQRYVRKLIATGKLWAPDTSGKRTSTPKDGNENDPENDHLARVVTLSSGGSITIISGNGVNTTRSERGEDAGLPQWQPSEDGEPTREEERIQQSLVAPRSHRRRVTTTASEGGRGPSPPDSGDDDSEDEEGERSSVRKESNRRKAFISFEQLTRDADFEYLCGLSKQTFEVLYKYIGEFKPLEEHMFQDRKSQAQGKPSRFRSFKKLRVIIDCTEIRVETPSNFQQQGNTWSSYKHANTVKYLVGINCRGAITYVSEAFEGSMSDKEVFMRSSMYDMLQPGDVVMADRGFDIAFELDMIGVKLVIPSYLKGRDYLSAEEEIYSKKIARARIFVENAIGRLKMWRILNGPFPKVPFPWFHKWCLSVHV